MITEGLINIFFGIVSGFFTLLPEVSWSVDTSAFEYFLSILKVAGYVFPWGTVVAIALIVFSISIFRIVISFIKTIWDLLPIV